MVILVALCQVPWEAVRVASRERRDPGSDRQLVVGSHDGHVEQHQSDQGPPHRGVAACTTSETEFAREGGDREREAVGAFCQPPGQASQRSQGRWSKY